MPGTMIGGGVDWTYALAPDVIVEPRDAGVALGTPAGRVTLAGPAGRLVVERLSSGPSGEGELSAGIAGDEAAAVLFRLDRLGLLARTLASRGQALATCVPLRPPPDSPVRQPPRGVLRLSPLVVVQARDGRLMLSAPGSWAELKLHDRELVGLLHDLAEGRTAADMAAESVGHADEAIRAILALMHWCRLLDRAKTPVWPLHDLLLHARTRLGYTRVPIGKAAGADGAAASEAVPGGPRLPLAPPDVEAMRRADPPYAVVAEQRRSVRTHGAEPIGADQLSEFLWRTLHARDGRRPYPSGGARYPLNACVLVHRCLGVPPGLHRYDPVRHELSTLAEHGPSLQRLLNDAATAAAMAEPPQVLLLLSADVARMRQVYPDLAYSLILKEVGAIFQSAMLAAAAMRLAACPLGTGNSLAFSEIVGTDPAVETSVGEMALGSLPAAGPEGR